MSCWSGSFLLLAKLHSLGRCYADFWEDLTQLWTLDAIPVISQASCAHGEIVSGRYAVGVTNGYLIRLEVCDRGRNSPDAENPVKSPGLGKRYGLLGKLQLFGEMDMLRPRYRPWHNDVYPSLMLLPQTFRCV